MAPRKRGPAKDATVASSADEVAVDDEPQAKVVRGSRRGAKAVAAPMVEKPTVSKRGKAVKEVAAPAEAAPKKTKAPAAKATKKAPAKKAAKGRKQAVSDDDASEDSAEEQDSSEDEKKPAAKASKSRKMKVVAKKDDDDEEEVEVDKVAALNGAAAANGGESSGQPRRAGRAKKTPDQEIELKKKAPPKETKPKAAREPAGKRKVEEADDVPSVDDEAETDEEAVETKKVAKTEKGKKASRKRKAEVPEKNDVPTPIDEDDEKTDEDLQETKKKETKLESAKKAPEKPKVAEKSDDVELTPSHVDDASSEENDDVDDEPVVPKDLPKTSRKSVVGNLPNFRVSTWNVAGLRAWFTKKKAHVFLEVEDPDIVCLQETKCGDADVPAQFVEYAKERGYKSYFLGSTAKKGHAGVALLTKQMPIEVKNGIGDEEFDTEGRLITLEFEHIYVLGVYVPNSGRGLVTLDKRLKWNGLFLEYVRKLDAIKPVLIVGDMNVSHQEMDLKNPKNNKRNAGFTQEERDGFGELLDTVGLVDVYRDLYPDETDCYTYWTYMANARAKNVGWRLDYCLVSQRLMQKVCDVLIRKDVMGSDHCPITIFMSM